MKCFERTGLLAGVMVAAVMGCEGRAARGVPSQLPPSAPAPAPATSAPPAPSWPDTRLAASVATRPLGAANIEVLLSRNELRGAGRVVAPLPPEAARALGFPAELKPSANPNHLKVEPLAALIEPLTRQAGQPARARVVVDAATPYRILIEVLFTLGQSGVGVYEMPVQNGAHVTQIEVTVPKPAAPEAPIVKSLRLTALIVSDGISLKAAGGNIGPGCEGVKPGPTFPRIGSEHDFAAIRACAEKVRASDPDFARESEVVIAANPDVVFQTVVRLIDALGTTSAGAPMFTDVHFGIAR